MNTYRYSRDKLSSSNIKCPYSDVIKNEKLTHLIVITEAPITRPLKQHKNLLIKKITYNTVIYKIN